MSKLSHYLAMAVFPLFLTCLATSSFADSMTIIVQPFENTGDNQYSWVSVGMTDTVIADLARIRKVNVVSNADRKQVGGKHKGVFSFFTEDQELKLLGLFMDAHIIFTGTYFVSGNRITVHAIVLNVETNKIQSTAKIEGTLSGILDLQDKVVVTLMGLIEKIRIPGIKPVKFAAEDKNKIKNKPKPKVTAYEWYAKGLALQDSDPKEALFNFRKAIEIDPNYTDALINAAFTAGNTLEFFNEALEYLERAEKIVKGRKETNTARYATLLNSIGEIYHTRGELDRALEYYLNSQSMQDKLGLKNTGKRARLIGTDAYANLVTNIGVVYRLKGDPDRALDYFLKSRSIQDRLGLKNTADYATLMNNIGEVYRYKRELDRALEYYLNSQSIQDGLGLKNTADYARLIMSIGDVYIYKEEFDRALKYYLNSQSVLDGLGLKNTADYATLMNNIGEVYRYKRELDRALEYYLNSQSILETIGLKNTATYAIILHNFALVYEKQGKCEMAGKHYRMAYDIYVKADYSGSERNEALESAKRLGY